MWKIIVGFLLALSVMLPVLAADYPATVSWQVDSQPGPLGSTPALACTNLNTDPNNANKWSFYGVGSGNRYFCQLTWSDGSISYKQAIVYSMTCPYGGTNTVGGVQSTTTATYTCVGGTGPAPVDPCADKNQIIRKFYYSKTVSSYVAPDHFGACNVSAQEMLVCRTDAGGPYCVWKISRTGAKFTGVDVPGNGAGGTDAGDTKTDPVIKSPPIANPVADPKACPNCPPCPAGTVQFGFDSSGIPICGGTGTTPPDAPKPPLTTTNPTVTTTQADGSTKAVTVASQVNADGSTTTTTTTKTTTTAGVTTTANDVQTSATPSGSPGRFDNLPADQNNLCKQNPNLAVCMNSSVTGTCGAITCTGDAIQCATLRATAAMQCKQQADDDALRASPQNALGTQIMSGNDPMKSSLDDLVKGSSVDMSKPSLDATGFLGSGSCIADKTFTVSGHSVSVSFASICSNIQPLRYIIMACAYIVAYLMVARSVLND